jgi:hypothetical protein
MTIRFVCSCGKHLRARDEMAARRSFCPRCGSPVGIPSLKPTVTGGLLPMTPAERVRHASQRVAPPNAIVQSETPPQAPLVDNRVRLLARNSTKGRRRPAAEQYLEKRWQQFLLYPLRALRLCLALAVFLAFLSAVLAVFLPELFLHHPQGGVVPLLTLRAIGVALVLVIIGLPCSFLECVLVSAVEGEVFYITWSGNPATTVLLSGVKWLGCFLAGSVVFAATGYVYWLNCGEASPLDVLILVELGVVAIGYWLYTLLAVTDQGWLRGLNPIGVADLFYRLGRRGLGVVLLAGLLLLAHAGLLVAGVAAVHKEPVKGLAMLAGGWASAVFWSTFFCRLLGVWCYRSRAAVVPAPAAEGETTALEAPR